MINARLVWYLEINNLISPVQSGFRSERSTNDNLVRLETFIRDAFVKKEHVVLCFLTWKKHMIPLGSMEFYVIYTSSELRAHKQIV